MKPSELELVRDIRRLAGGRHIGDDCAVLPHSSREDLLVTTDMLLEGVHFRRATHSAAACGRRALARALSDIAAMGGRPRWCFISAAFPDWCAPREFLRGVLGVARRYGVELAGGDTSRAKKLFVDVNVLGTVAKGRALLRGGARAGDCIYVSGRLGRNAARGWCDTPVPRIELGQQLRRLGATACIDLSDGLALDLHRLCVESRLSAELSSPLPIFRGATLQQALSGGEDYELLFTARPGLRGPFTAIGKMKAGAPGQVLLDSRPLTPAGWDPFSR